MTKTKTSEPFAGYAGSVFTTLPGLRLVEVRGHVILAQISACLYVVVSPDGFDDTRWTVPAMVAHAGGPPSEDWSVTWETHGDVLMTYFYRAE